MSYNSSEPSFARKEHDIMDDDTARAPAINKARHRRGFGPSLALVGLLATMGLLVAACAGDATNPGAASASSTTTSTTVASSGSSGPVSPGDASQSQQLQFAQCMRSHGVPNFPDPDPGAGGGSLNAISAAGINTQSPTYQATLQACKKYNPGANVTPAQGAAQNAKGLEMSQCMRSHGVPNFPDPIAGPTGGQAINLSGTGIDQNSPTYQGAAAACQKLFPGSK
jgi:hypothetical protein